MSDEHATPADGQQETETPAQGGDQGTEVKAIVASALKEFQGEALNRAISGHMKRVESRQNEQLQELVSQAVASALKSDKEAKDEAGLSAAERERKQWEKRFQDMETKLKASEEKARSAEEARQKAARTQSLQSLLTGKVADAKVAVPYFESLLKLDAEGNYVGTDEFGNEVALADFVEQTIAGTPSLQPPSNRRGGGGTGPAPSPGSPARELNGKSMSRAQYMAKIAELRKGGDTESINSLNQKVLARELIVQGVNDQGD